MDHRLELTWIHIPISSKNIVISMFTIIFIVKKDTAVLKIATLYPDFIVKLVHNIIKSLAIKQDFPQKRQLFSYLHHLLIIMFYYLTNHNFCRFLSKLSFTNCSATLTPFIVSTLTKCA